jgi:uncharacterized protein (TIGR02271 family)
MTQTLVGLFDSMSDAQRASDRLAQEGIARTDIHVHAQDGSRESEMPDEVLGSGGTPTRTVAADTGDGAPHEGGIAHFFKRLFGNDDAPEEVGHYRESVRRGHALLSVDVVDESRIDAVRIAMNDAGAMDIEARVTQWKTAGYSGYDSSAPAYTADEIAEDRKTFPVVREDLTVGKREVSTGGVRVYSRVTETPVSESVNLREEHATIERRTVDRPATEADRKEGAVEIRETAEEPVVAKTARVVEEVVVGKESSQRTETVNDTVRGTQVEVERDAGNAATGGADPVNRKPL